MLLGHEVSEYIPRILTFYLEIPVYPINKAFKYMLASIHSQSGFFALPLTL